VESGVCGGRVEFDSRGGCGALSLWVRSVWGHQASGGVNGRDSECIERAASLVRNGPRVVEAVGG
jgi:hypothetical protein